MYTQDVFIEGLYNLWVSICVYTLYCTCKRYWSVVAWVGMISFFKQEGYSSLSPRKQNVMPSQAFVKYAHQGIQGWGRHEAKHSNGNAVRAWHCGLHALDCACNLFKADWSS
jgi:hypothetical protein